MVDFALSEGQKSMIATFREFGESMFTPEHVFQWRKDQGLPDEVAKGFVDRYFSLANQGDMGIMSQTLILEELCRCAGAALPFQNDLFNLQIMADFADEAVFSKVLDEYRETGRLVFSLAVSEPNAGSDTMSMTTSVQTVDGKLILNGKKTYVNNGEYSPSILCAAIDKDANTDDKYPPLSFWLVPHNLPGIRAVPINKIGQSMVPFASVSFDNVEIKPSIACVATRAASATCSSCWSWAVCSLAQHRWVWRRPLWKMRLPTRACARHSALPSASSSR